jgi:hypothetical protein
MVLGIWESLGKAGDSVRDFLINADRNPVVWIGLFLLGIAVFFFTYNALHKN